MTSPTQDQINTAVQSWFDAEIFTDAIGENTNALNQLYIGKDQLVSDIFAQVSGDSEAIATGTLTFTPGTIADDKIIIDGVYYQYCTTVSGSADGTSGTPWQVAKGASATAGLLNLKNAINGGIAGVVGTDFSSGITAHSSVKAISSGSTTVVVNALAPGVAGNSIATTVTAVSGADGFAWGASTLASGAGTDFPGVEDVVNSWRDSVRCVPIELDEDSIDQLDAAIPVLISDLAALLP